ncbi:30S ribosomal protein S1 [bacterium]|nr:30S ribosomal protein S1 [bacterium]
MTTKKELKQLYEESFARESIRQNQIVEGRVIQVEDEGVLIDIGYKVEGIIPRREFREPPKAGEKISAYVVKRGGGEGLILLSKKRAEETIIWQKLSEAYEKQKLLEGTVRKKVKGGLMVDVGCEGFLPGSHLDLFPRYNLEEFIGKKIKVRIIKLDRKRKNLVLSRKVILEEERAKVKERIFSQTQVGDILKGRVKSLTTFGAFIDLGGFDGLIHIKDISYAHLRHPSEILAMGEEVEALVLFLDKEREKISLGLKQLRKDPWEEAEKKYPPGSVVEGKITTLTEYGAFVELEEGLEGLLHVSRVSCSSYLEKPSSVLKTGEKIGVKVLNVDSHNQRMTLDRRGLLWEEMEKKYPIGSKVKGKITGITRFGAFLKLEEGLEGLIHISDLSWKERVSHPSKIVKEGEEYEVVILDINPEEEKISLGLKQLTPDPYEKFKEGGCLKVKVIDIVPFGVFVELEKGIEGLIHISQLVKGRVESCEDAVSLGEEVMAKIVKVDREERKIALSIKEYLLDKEEEEMREYMGSAKEAKTSLRDLMKKERR